VLETKIRIFFDLSGVETSYFSVMTYALCLDYTVTARFLGFRICPQQLGVREIVRKHRDGQAWEFSLSMHREN